MQYPRVGDTGETAVLALIPLQNVAGSNTGSPSPSLVGAVAVMTGVSTKKGRVRKRKGQSRYGCALIGQLIVVRNASFGVRLWIWERRRRRVV